MKKIVLSLLVPSFLFLSCEKEANRKLLDGYFSYEANGVKTKIVNDNTIIGTNLFNCTLSGDSLLTITVAQSFAGGGFVIRTNNVHNGSYELNADNKGYYNNPKDYKRYTTNNNYKGILTIKKGTFQAKTLLQTVEGTFSFEGVDPLNSKTVKVTNGKFLMEVKSE
ncbi:MAG: hypothetical protein JWQ96_2637 [Segetibacter sp.]|nr:hypothetical protein [Segetibacter sp.]